MQLRFAHILSLPVANYSPAIARAVEWLGDRYLLAKPINAARAIESRRAAARVRRISENLVGLSGNGLRRGRTARLRSRVEPSWVGARLDTDG